MDAATRARLLIFEGVREAYGSGRSEEAEDAPRPEGIRYHRTHCPSCGRPVNADRICAVHGAPKED